MQIYTPATVLEGEFWTEPVRTVKARAIGAHIRVEAVGSSTGCFYSRLLLATDLERIRQITQASSDYSRRGESFFLAGQQRLGGRTPDRWRAT